MFRLYQLRPLCVRVKLETMTRSLKTFLLWLLIAALPIQGFAAALQRSCSSGHQAMAVFSVPASDSRSDTGASAHAGMDQHLGMVQADMDHVGPECDDCMDSASASTEKSPDSHHINHGSCSTCASCCVGAYAPPSFLSFTLSFDYSEIYQVSAATIDVGFIPDSLERPPRHPAV